MSPGTTPPGHCHVCPTVLNREKQLAIAIGALNEIGGTEATRALKSIRVLAELTEPTLCENERGAL